jgi:hypothetical protein
MKIKIVVATALAACVLAPLAGTQQQDRPKAQPVGEEAVSAKLVVAPDVPQRLAKWRVVQMPFHQAGLSERERKLVYRLVSACHYLENIYWRQSDSEALTLYQSLKRSQNPRDVELRRMLMINGSRFDLLDDNKPFVSTQPMPPGRGFYPENLTREQIEEYAKQHPEKKNEIYSGYTVVRGNRNQLTGVPYHVAYRSFLEPAARDLREAAALSDDPQFASFLRLRADALLSDDYYKSDLAWLDLKNPKFDVIFAPYEVYLDSLLGVKTSYGAAVLVRNEVESRKLSLFQKYVPDIQEALPLAPEDRPSKRGLATPMEVMDAPFRAADLRHGYQAVADNLPNDPRVHEAKGSKKIFFKNFMDARVRYVILPVAKRLMQPEQAAKASGEGYLATTMMHEISHGIGPAFSRTAGGKVNINEAIGSAYSGLEEAKADVVGMFGLKWLIDHGALPKARLPEYYSSYVAGIFRTVRFGTGEAHGRAEMMEFNFLNERKAITRDPKTGKYAIDYPRMSVAIEELTKELLQQEASGDRARAEAWFKKYDVMPAELQSALKAASNLPVDLDPVYSFPEPVE